MGMGNNVKIHCTVGHKVACGRNEFNMSRANRVIKIGGPLRCPEAEFDALPAEKKCSTCARRNQEAAVRREVLGVPHLPPIPGPR